MTLWTTAVGTADESMSAKITRALCDVPADRLGVIFIGHEPRLIGTIGHTESIERIKQLVDPMLIGERLSAEFISRARLANGRICVVAHA
jgi:hypothetical protein